jgi:hypothetical protein
MEEDNGGKKFYVKVAGEGPMERNSRRSQMSRVTVKSVDERRRLS